MNRRHITFECEGSLLVGSIDAASGRAGLLIVTGGNEIRAGAWNGQAQFAARIAAHGHPVMRFDRRGTGDSQGVNGEYRSNGPDIAAALAAFRRECPQLNHVVALGNCDAASALMLLRGAGFDGLVLSNPWTFDDAAVETAVEAEVAVPPPPPAVLRDHYRRRLTDPKAIWRLLTGKVSLRKLSNSLQEAAAPPPPPPTLLSDMAAGIASFVGPIRFLIADRDRTGMTFASLWEKHDTRVHRCPGASHSFVEKSAQVWLEEQVLAVLRG